MIASLWSLFKGASLAWKLAPVILVVVLAVGGYVLWLRADNADLRADLVAARRDAAIYEEAARRTAESFERYQADVERQRAIVAGVEAGARARAVAEDQIEREIVDAPEGDAPAGALADSVLDRLRELSAASD